MKCKAHDDFITLYCENDKQLLCVQCLFAGEQHKGHSVGPIKMALNHMRSDAEFFRSLIQDKVRKIDAAMNKSQANKQFLEQMQSHYSNIVQQEFEQMYQALKRKEEELKGQIAGLFSHGIECYNTLIGEYQSGLANCQELIKHQSSNDMGIEFTHQLLKQLAEQVNKIQVDVHEMTDQDIDVINFQQTGNILSMIENYVRFDNLPELFDSQQPPNKKPRQSSEKKKAPSSNLATEPSTYQSPIKKNVYYQKIVGGQASKPGAAGGSQIKSNGPAPRNGSGGCSKKKVEEKISQLLK